MRPVVRDARYQTCSQADRIRSGATETRRGRGRSYSAIAEVFRVGVGVAKIVTDEHG
jgi:hypothetical protein